MMLRVAGGSELRLTSGGGEVFLGGLWGGKYGFLGVVKGL